MAGRGIGKRNNVAIPSDYHLAKEATTDYRKAFLVEPGKRLHLAERDPGYKGITKRMKQPHRNWNTTAKNLLISRA